MSCCADQIDCCESEVVDDVPGSVEDCPFECAFKEHLEAARLRLSRETAGQLRLPMIDSVLVQSTGAAWLPI